MNRAALIGIVVMLLVAGAGCVKRSLLVKSDPSGAAVFIDESIVILVARCAVDVALDFGSSEKPLGGVRIQTRNRIEGHRLEQVRRGRAFPILQHQPLEPGCDDGRPRQIIALDPRHHDGQEQP